MRLVLPPKSYARFSYQGDDDLAIRSGLEVVSLLEVLSNVTMVVDLTVDGENDAVVGVGQGLGSGLCEKLSVVRASRCQELTTYQHRQC